MKRAALLAALLVLGGSAPIFLVLGGFAAVSAEPITVQSEPIERFAPAGADGSGLTYLGGVVLRSDDPRFGGFSGIALLDAEHALIESDIGWLMRATLVRQDGRLTGVADTEIDPAFPGGPVPKRQGDVEDIALDPSDMSRGVIVRERQANAMLSFRMQDGLPTDFKPQRVGAPNDLLRSNQGLESVAYAPAGSPLAGEIIAIAEHPPRGMSDIPGWVAGVGPFAIVRHDDFDISSARFLPNGDLILLERRFTPTTGIAIRLRRIPGDTIAVGARLDGEILLDAGLTTQIDNMEGLAVHQDDAGRTILTLISDDNQNFLQRTLILEFALAEDR